MKIFAILALVAGAPLCLGGCALNAANIGAATTFVNALAAAGCSGTVHASASATTAAMGVPSANVSNTFDGACNPPAAAKAATP